MLRILRAFFILLSTLGGLAGCGGFIPTVEHGFLKQEVTTAQGLHRFFIYRPTHVTPGEKLPVILYLHGGGENGDDGILPTQVGLGPVVQQTLGYFPFLVVFPQATPRGFWAMPDMAQRAVDALELAIKNYDGDPERVYVTGNSMGGFGTWYLAARHLGRFAALAPICGGVKPPPWIKVPKSQQVVDLDGDTYASMAEKLGLTPVCIFHGKLDPLVPPRASRKMAEAIRRRGGLVRHTEWRGVGHAAEVPTYAEPTLFEWFLKQRRGQPSPDAGEQPSSPQK